MRAPSSRLLVLTVLAVVLAVVVAGCGGDEDTEGGSGTGLTATPTAPPAAQGEGSLGDATFADGGETEEVIAGAVPITPATTKAAGGNRRLPRCPNDTVTITAGTRARAEASATCLVNKVRRRSGRRGLESNPKLADAARKHATDMVQQHFFSHVSPGGTTATARVRSTGYLSGAGRPQVGENIAWGSGTFSTPAAIVQSWMNSRGHRQNVLRRSYREAGLAIAVGAPVSAGGDAGTYVQAFGRR
jgi:uncharacterized protein YkwD